LSFPFCPYFWRHVTVSDSLARYHDCGRRRREAASGHSCGRVDAFGLHGIVPWGHQCRYSPRAAASGLPFIIVTLGFFILVVNTLTFWLAGGLVPGFSVDGFWNAFFGSIVVSIVSWALRRRRSIVRLPQLSAGYIRTR
jgi:hypothetical protein